MKRSARISVPASSANLGPGFDVLALALNLYLEVEARPAERDSIVWKGEGAGEVPQDRHNLILKAARAPFLGWSEPLPGVEIQVSNRIPIGRGLGSSAAAIVAGIMLGACLRGLRISPQRVMELALPLEGHADNLAAALFGGFCVVTSGDGGARVHRIDWPPRWTAVVFVPKALSPTHEARRLVPLRPNRADAVFNLGRVAEWILACTRADRSLVATAMEDRLHQPGRSKAYPYLDDMIAAALQSGALGAALSGAGGSVIAIADRGAAAIGSAMTSAAQRHGTRGGPLVVKAAPTGAKLD